MDISGLTRRILMLLMMIVAALGAVLNPAIAEVQRSLINQGFEAPDLVDRSCIMILRESHVPGWNTTHGENFNSIDRCNSTSFPGGSGGFIEMWSEPFQGVPALQGTQLVELNAHQDSRLSQNVCLQTGEVVKWSFGHRARGGSGSDPVQKARLSLNDKEQIIVSVSAPKDGGRGKVEKTTLGTATWSDGGNGWNRYSGEFVFRGKSGTTDIGFGAFGKAGSSGNFLDDINLTLRPYVEITNSKFASDEGDADGLPAIRILGVTKTPINVKVSVTGGTATRKTKQEPTGDYSTPGNTSTITVTIPAGDYGEGRLFPIGFGGTKDALTPERDETVRFRLSQPQDDSYKVESTTICGGTPISEAVWTIRDYAQSVALVKTGSRIDNGDGAPSVGDTIRYKFTITNNGTSPLTNIRLKDDLEGLRISGGPIARLAVGATDTRTYTATYKISADDMKSGKVVNQAVVTATTDKGKTIQSNNSKVVVPIKVSPSITLKKMAKLDDDNRGYSKIGDSIAYTFVITNNGNIDLNNVTLRDNSLPRTITGTPIAKLAAGESRTVSATTTVTQAQLNAGKIINKATVSGTTATGLRVTDTDTVTTRLVQNASVTLKKKAGKPSSGKAGGTIAYKFIVINKGDVPLKNIVINDPKTGKITCNKAKVDLDESATCTASYTISQADVKDGKVRNEATASALTPSGKKVVSSPAKVTTDLPTIPAFTLSKTADRVKVSKPGPIKYKITVKNTGTINLTGIKLTDTGPAKTALPLTGPETDTGTVGALDVGETWAYNVTYQVTQDDIDRGIKLVNTVSATSDQTGDAPQQDDAITKVMQNPAFSVFKTVDAKTIKEPKTLNYKIAVTNSGNMTLNPPKLTDTPPNGPAFTPVLSSGDTDSDGLLDVKETWKYTATYRVTQDDIDRGIKLVNTVSATSDQTGDAPQQDEAVTKVLQNPAFSVFKTVDAKTIKEPKTLNYKIAVTNSGNMTLNPPKLTDTPPNGPAFTPVLSSGDTDSDGLLDVKESWTYLASYDATDADIFRGKKLVNKADVLATAVSGMKLPDQSDNATTSINKTHEFNVKTTADQSAITEPTTLNYTITIENAGNQHLNLSSITNRLSTGPHHKSSVIVPDDGDDDLDTLLDAEETWTYKVAFDVDQTVIDANDLLTNFVEVQAAEIAEPGKAEAVTRINRKSDITVMKSVDLQAISGPGYLTYTITVTNSGNTGQTGVNIADILPDGTLAKIPEPTGNSDGDSVLDVDEIWTYEVPFPVTQEMIDKGDDLISQASVTTDKITQAETSKVVTRVRQVPDYKLEVDADPEVMSEPGAINYTVTVANTGNATLTGVVVADTPHGADMPADLTLAEGDTDSDGELDVDETWSYEVQFTVTQEMIDKGDDLISQISVTTDKITQAETSKVVTRVRQVPDYKLDVDADPEVMSEPGAINYTVTVANTGNATLTGVVVADTPHGADMPADLTLAEGDTDSDGELDVDETWSYEVQFTVTQEMIDKGKDIVRSVSLTSAEISEPKTAEARTELGARPSLQTDLNVDTTEIHAPGTLNYTITLVNSGNVTLSDLTVTNEMDGKILPLPLPKGDTDNDGQMDVGEIWIYTIAYPVNQKRIGASEIITSRIVVNSAQTPESVASVDTLISQMPALQAAKSQVWVDDGNSFANEGDQIDYRVSLTNTGNVPLTGVMPSDPGPTFNGIPGTGVLSAFSPVSAALDIGETVHFAASYTLTQTDISRGAGIANGVKNTAGGVAKFGDQVVHALPASTTMSLPAEQSGDVSIIKETLTQQIRRGETASFRITVSNGSTGNVGRITVRDTMPAGFAFLPGSATVDGVPADPQISDRNVSLSGIQLGPKATVTVDLRLRALGTARPGQHINRANVEQDGRALAPEARVGVTITGEALFDCSEVIGKVFHDGNRNGYQDKGEQGIPSVRLATVRGMLITTDEYGRYSVPCAAQPNLETGSNYVLKLDARSLPSGFSLTTENPASARLIGGKATELNFGVSHDHKVLLELGPKGFLSGRAEPAAGLSAALPRLIDILAQKPSILAITYTGTEARLAAERMELLRQQLEEAWSIAGEPYPLLIETTIHSGG